MRIQIPRILAVVGLAQMEAEYGPRLSEKGVKETAELVLWRRDRTRTDPGTPA